jgi:hypothetical protein
MSTIGGSLTPKGDWRRPNLYAKTTNPSGARRSSTIKKELCYHGAALACTAIALSVVLIATGPTSRADPPPNSDLIRPLPVVTPTPTNWAPKFPWPYDQTRNHVTHADIVAEREMCQWFNADYDTLYHQIDRLQFNRISSNGTDFDYSVDGVQHQVDIVTSNIDQSLAFLTPRVQALTQSQDFAGDLYFPIYKGDAFYYLWQQLSNVNDGIKAHQADWFTGPSVLRAKKWGSEIQHSHVCE